MVKTSLFLKYYSSEHIFHPLLYFSLVQGRMGRVFPINFYDVCQHLLNTFITNRVVFLQQNLLFLSSTKPSCKDLKALKVSSRSQTFDSLYSQAILHIVK